MRTLISNGIKLLVVIFLRQIGHDPEYEAGPPPLPRAGCPTFKALRIQKSQNKCPKTN